jgi:heme/copper-type cytochrome/quinol oxidase subunit 2
MNYEIILIAVFIMLLISLLVFILTTLSILECQRRYFDSSM